VGELTVLVAARDEEKRIGATVTALREAFPEAEVIVADDGSADGTARAAKDAGARVLKLPRRGKGQALSLAEQEAPPGALLLCDADLTGDLRPLLEEEADLAVAIFAERQGGGFGIVKRTARELLRLATGRELREPLSGQRALSARARERCFPTAAGFGCEARMTLDALRAGLEVREVELPLGHRSTGRDLPGFLHRARQLRDLLLAFGPVGPNHRGLRLPLVGWTVGLVVPRVAPVVAIGLVDDLAGGPRRLSGALLVGLAANALNQLDTKPGRALKIYALAALPLRAPLLPAVILAPYDLREMAMLGDAGSNSLGALLGLNSVDRFTGRSRWLAIGALAALNLVGELRSLGELIERTRVLRDLDRLGRQP
jgi:hypothetical protein